MATITFGSGKLFFKDSSSNVYQVGVMDDVSVNFDSSTKELYGSKQFPVATAVTAKKVTGDAKFAQINGKLISTLMSGTTTAGRNILLTASTTGSSITVPTGTGFDRDFGVIDNAGNPMTLTASAPAVGAYTCNTGTGAYAFSGTEPGTKTVSYTAGTGSGSTYTITNAQMGTQNSFTLFLQEQGIDGEYFGLELFSVVIPSLNFGFKNEDFSSQDLKFSAQVNTADQIGKVYYE